MNKEKVEEKVTEFLESEIEDMDEVRKEILVSGNQAREILFDMKNRISPEAFQEMEKETRRRKREIKEAIQLCISLLSYGARERNPISKNQAMGILVDMENRIILATFLKMAKETKRSVKEIQDTIHKCITLLS